MWSDRVIISPGSVRCGGMATTFDLQQCADFLKVHPDTLLGLANSGVLPGAKIGRAWVFLEDDVVTYLREQIAVQVENRKRAKAGLPSIEFMPSVSTTAALVLRRRGRRPRRVIPELPP